MITHKAFTSALIALITSMQLLSAQAVDMNQRARELQDLKWGMFVCWSFSTFSGKEWTPGVKDVSDYLGAVKFVARGRRIGDGFFPFSIN